MDEAMKIGGQNSDQWALLDIPSFNIDMDLKASMCATIEDSNLSRDQVVDRMNTLAKRHGVCLNNGNAKTLTKDTLDKWLNPNEPGRTIPTRALKVFCAVLNDFRSIGVFVEGTAWRLSSPEEVAYQGYGKAILEEKKARQSRLGIEKELLK